MNTKTLSALVTLSTALGAFAQGTIGLENANIPSSVATDTAGNFYTGTFGIEVWALNADAVPSGINLPAGPGSGLAGYNAMLADGFTLQATFTRQTTVGGIFIIGSVALPSIRRPQAVLALAVWDTSGTSWAAMLSAANANTRAGVLAFVNSVSDSTVPLSPAPLTGWSQDLVMSAIPEPSALALASLGGVLLLVLCRRRPAERRSLA